MNSYLFHNSPIQPEKQKSAAQNRTKTTNCLNSVSYGAWKFFSPYGSCSACTIRNRFALLGFQSISAASAFNNITFSQQVISIFPHHRTILIYRANRKEIVNNLIKLIELCVKGELYFFENTFSKETLAIIEATAKTFFHAENACVSTFIETLYKEFSIVMSPATIEKVIAI